MPKFTQLDSILQRVLELPAERREAFLDETCGEETELRRIVGRMVQASEADDPVLKPGGALSGALWEQLCRRQRAGPLGIGDRVGPYRIEQTLGVGGMATVYLAERADGQFEQSVALKVLQPARHSEEVRRRFEQERQILASLDHPGVARLVDGGLTASGQPYVAMEYIDGEHIDAWCDRERPSLRTLLGLFLEVCDAVEYAHRNLVVHRDLKPSNILVTPAGRPKLLDFGIAKLLDSTLPYSAPATRSALHPMTPEYASPEQVSGGALTTATDVYQLGYLLYRLATDRSPYDADPGNYAEVLDAICHRDPERPSAVVARPAPADGAMADDTRASSDDAKRLQRALRGDLDTVILKALAKDPALRYSSVQAFAGDLRRHLQGLPVTAQRASLAYRARKFLHRHRPGTALAAAMVLLLAGLAVFYTVESTQRTAEIARQRDIARLEAAKAERVVSFLSDLLASARPDRTKGEELSVLELLDDGAARMDEELADQPEVHARMLGVVADSYFELGAYARARDLSRKQLAVESQFLGPGDPRIARTLRRVGEHEYYAGNLDAARAALERALQFQPSGAEGSVERGRTLSSLGIVLRALGDFAGARAAHEESLPLVEASGDREHKRQAWTNYGNLLLVTDAYDDAARAYRKALGYQDDLESTRAAGLMANIGMATAAAHRPGEGLAWFGRATRIFEDLLPPDHPSLAKLYSATAECLLMLQRYAESYATQAQALRVYETALGEEHFELNFPLIEMGDVLLYTGNPGGAERYYRRALAIIEDSAGRDSVNAGYAMQKLGVSRLRQGDPAGATRWLGDALPILEETLGDEHVRTNLARIRLGVALLRQDHFQQAGQLLESALRSARANTRADVHDVAVAEGAWGEYLLVAGAPRRSEPLLVASYAALEDDPDRAGVAAALERLRSLYMALDMPGKASVYAARKQQLREWMKSVRLPDPEG